MFVQDLDGDGNEDLLLVYEKGMGEPKLVFETFAGRGGAPSC